MSNLIIILTLIYFSWFTFGNEFDLKNIKYTFQSDLYIVKNNCGDIYMSYPQALRIEILLPSDYFKKKLKINFTESNSKFTQNIIYNKKTFFYPGVFGINGHHEYDIPHCEDKQNECEFGFFVFISGPMKNLEKWNANLNIINEENEKQQITISNQILNNAFAQKNNDYLFTNLDFKKTDYTDLNIAYIDPAKVKTLVNKNFDVEFVFSWRNSIEQIEYSEEFHNISSESAWLSKNSFEFPMTKKIKSPTYLSFMIHARKDPIAYESKIVIIDKKQDFFKQCRK